MSDAILRNDQDKKSGLLGKRHRLSPKVPGLSHATGGRGTAGGSPNSGGSPNHAGRAAILLDTHRVEKPWGRHDLSPLFPDQPEGAPAIGEIWFDDPEGVARELLVKYLFTSERLSVQVHPDDAAAQARGYARGKDEAWIVLSAEPDSTIALGFEREMDPAAVRQGALDGSIEQMLHWQPVKAGDVIYSPARTVHAIGKGLRIIEVQQNLDLTYRFYDYGSPRELHLDDAMAVSDFGPFQSSGDPRSLGDGRLVMAEGGRFILERWTMAADLRLSPGSAPVWLMPVEGNMSIDGMSADIGEVFIAQRDTLISIKPASLLYVAYPGGRVIDGLITR